MVRVRHDKILIKENNVFKIRLSPHFEAVASELLHLISNN